MISNPSTVVTLYQNLNLKARKTRLVPWFYQRKQVCQSQLRSAGPRGSPAQRPLSGPSLAADLRQAPKKKKRINFKFEQTLKEKSVWTRTLAVTSVTSHWQSRCRIYFKYNPTPIPKAERRQPPTSACQRLAQLQATATCSDVHFPSLSLRYRTTEHLLLQSESPRAA